MGPLVVYFTFAGRTICFTSFGQTESSKKSPERGLFIPKDHLVIMKIKEQERGNTTDMESISSSTFSAGSIPASVSVSQTPTVSTLLSIRLVYRIILLECKVYDLGPILC